MAIVHKGKSPARTKSTFYLIFGLIFLLSGIVLHLSWVFPWGMLLFLIGGGLLGAYSRNHAGISGEDEAISSLKELLSDEYHIFTNVRVHEKMESDIVVVGPKHVFIVEVKHLKGELEGTAEDKFWILHKTGRKGGQYSTQIKNPLGQLRRNTFILSQYLKMEGCPCWIEGVVYFAGTETEWMDAVPDKCFGVMKYVAKYIVELAPEKTLSKDRQAKIMESLEKCLFETPPMQLAEFSAKVDELKAKRNKNHPKENNSKQAK